MTQYRVQLWGQPGRSVTVEANATKGAVLGVNLYWPDGRLVTPQDFAGDDADPVTGEFPVTYWKLIQEVPENIRQLAALTGSGYAYRRPDGTWELRRIGRAVVPFSFGDASPMSIYIPREPGVLTLVRLDIKTAFDGAGASLTVGTADDAEAFVSASEVDPAVVAGWEVVPDADVAAAEPILLHINPGTGPTTGAGRVLIDVFPLQET
jgi:hypothetical protein